MNLLEILKHMNALYNIGELKALFPNQLMFIDQELDEGHYEGVYPFRLPLTGCVDFLHAVCPKCSGNSWELSGNGNYYWVNVIVNNEDSYSIYCHDCNRDIPRYDETVSKSIEDDFKAWQVKVRCQVPKGVLYEAFHLEFLSPTLQKKIFRSYQTGLDDDQVMSFVSDRFGIWGSRSTNWKHDGHGIWTQHKGGEKPEYQVYIYRSGITQVLGRLTGSSLTKAFRGIFLIREPENVNQLELF